MPKVSSYTQTQIKLLYKQGLHPAEIFKLLKGEGLLVSFASVTWIVKKLQLTGSVANLPRSGRPRKLYVEVNAFIDQQMRSNDDMVGRLSLHLGQVAHQARAYPSFCSMKRLQEYIPLDGMLVYCRVTHSIKFTDTHVQCIHLGGERHCEGKVSCLRTQHNVPGQGSNPDHTIWRWAH